MKQYTDFGLLDYNTFGMNVRAAVFIEYNAVDELRQLLSSDLFARYCNHFIHIGAGSNLLFMGNYDGLVLHSAVTDLSVIGETSDEVFVRVGSGYVWDDFVAYCVEHGWTGVENLSAIPGEVGASAVQNIGAYGVEVCDVIERVETLSLRGEERIFVNEECGYGYRDSVFKRDLHGQYIVTHVVYRLSKSPNYKLDYGALRACVEATGEPTLVAVRNAVIAIRNSKLPNPKVLGNAGSFFTNPVLPRTQYETLLVEYPDMPSYMVDDTHVKIPAAWLIEHTGWKGRSLGRVAVHDRQALVLVNKGGATGNEVSELAQRVCDDIFSKFGIRVIPEVNYIY